MTSIPANARTFWERKRMVAKFFSERFGNVTIKCFLIVLKTFCRNVLKTVLWERWTNVRWEHLENVLWKRSETYSQGTFNNMLDGNKLKNGNNVGSYKVYEERSETCSQRTLKECYMGIVLRTLKNETIYILLVLQSFLGNIIPKRSETYSQGTFKDC